MHYAFMSTLHFYIYAIVDRGIYLFHYLCRTAIYRSLCTISNNICTSKLLVLFSQSSFSSKPSKHCFTFFSLHVQYASSELC